MDRELILVGGGGHCRSVYEAALAQGWKIKGVLDPCLTPGERIGNMTVLGNDDDIFRFVGDCAFVVTVGAIGVPDLRNKIIEKLKGNNAVFGTVVAPSAFVASDVKIGEGSVILNNVVLNANVEIGTNAIINTGAIIEHDSSVGDTTHISTGAILNGGCHVGKDCFIASGVIMMHGLSVGDRIVVGVGGVISKNLSEPGTYVGVPVRKIK